MQANQYKEGRSPEGGKRAVEEKVQKEEGQGLREAMRQKKKKNPHKRGSEVSKEGNVGLGSVATVHRRKGAYNEKKGVLDDPTAHKKEKSFGERKGGLGGMNDKGIFHTGRGHFRRELFAVGSTQGEGEKRLLRRKKSSPSSSWARRTSICETRGREVCEWKRGRRTPRRGEKKPGSLPEEGRGNHFEGRGGSFPRGGVWVSSTAGTSGGVILSIAHSKPSS